MDLQDVPVLKMTEQERRKNEIYIREILRQSDESVKKTVDRMRKAGYSDEDIDLFFDA